MSKRITIGRNYKREFESIVSLYQANCLDDEDIILSADNYHITTANDIDFIYDPSMNTFEIPNPPVIREDGASWFSVFRGGNEESSSFDDMAEWNNLIGRVSQNYHRKFSFLEYKNYASVDPEEADRLMFIAKDIMKRFVSLFRIANINDDNAYYERAGMDESVTNVYAISYRLDLSNGPRETRPLLGETYFRVINGVFNPLPVEDAKIIKEKISNNISAGEPGEFNVIGQNNKSDVDKTLEAFRKVTEAKNFADYIVYFDKFDEEVLANLFKEGDNSRSEIKCKKIHILSIHHVNWSDASYFLVKDNQRVLKFVFGAQNKTMSVYCASCDSKDNLIVKENVMTLGKQEITFDLEDDKLGMGNNYLNIVKRSRAEGPFAHHCFNVGPCNCKFVRKEGACTQVKCDSNCFVIKDDKGKSVKYCKDCPYPEMVSNINGEYYLTKRLKLIYINNKEDPEIPTLMNVEKTGTCSCCGRPIRIENKRCFTCAKLFSTANGKETAELFRKYSSMLPAHLRSKGGKAVEDSQKVVFLVNGSSYFINKLDIAEGKAVKLNSVKVKGGE